MTYEKFSITVIIPVFGRADLLKRLLVNLKNNQVTYEVIVVDNSSAGTKEQIKSICEFEDAFYIYLNQSVSAKRNIGAWKAKSDFLLFLDSDCEPAQGLLDAHLEYWKNASEKMIGALGVLEMVGRQNLLLKIINHSALLKPFQWAKANSYVPWGPTANFTVKRDLFLKINGFDEQLSPPSTGGEDVEFGLRARSKGYSIGCVRNALVFHSTETWLNFKDVVKRLWMWGKGDAELLRRFPQNLLYNPPLLSSQFMFLFVFSLLMCLISNNLGWVFLSFLWVLLVVFSNACINYFSGQAPYGCMVPFIYLILDCSRIFHGGIKGLAYIYYRFDFNENHFDEWKEIAMDQWIQHLSAFVILILFSFIS